MEFGGFPAGGKQQMNVTVHLREYLSCGHDAR